MYLNASLPHFVCLIRNEYLYNQTKGFGEYTPCIVFGVTSIRSRAVLFVCMLNNGAQIDRLPISAFCWKPSDPLPLDVVELWDCFSYHISVTQFDFLKGLQCYTLGKDKQWYSGEYVMTLDWAESPYAEDAGESGHKSGHLLKLATGHFAIMPNNRIYWREASFITQPLQPEQDRPDYITNEQNWSCEDGHKWHTEDSDVFFYTDVTLKETP